ncbi:NADP-dependent phosphogluconate dehydrogenase [Mucilaginibacter rubeus]|uniref:6-phosphogluconate dehydrogenase, decarboxylating n=1 Tax=Mucilaginibacter rubeus TaxID=2027860 RepID=A0AAE6JL48_9SPHI|nr:MULTISPECIES: NADP-dependent phosphogluconate dehydrogenase [Mucilaginibacter]QEM07321.1 NADP-dependent phosphogluconate dehydrogenase [Mucilaginibacter rubeus]QEM19775.1 NADP-dependent phosphogluconate dehydrogenase [Mucilaginibacter gossypii]QTE43522.1 NADP-dependent phosphogluconate dehydrogenase [Mucilaginibacter rubeus]QTE50122.1 NADP-dependent phosphogluconate dehydrogenase [Mucilaginibacter rubeus]QTE55211.1 NADP-dependent phosphogluconate dehydrogenase [Mucilaginibacter rubeus]
MSATENKYAFGMIGLGVMGRSLLLNMADHGFAVAGHDKDTGKVDSLNQEAGDRAAKGFADVKEFIQSLTTPRAIMMLVPAGKIVDAVIEELTPLLEKGDILIDGGNSHFTDTNRRVEELEAKGLHFFGMGVSGGEEGARRGPSMMPGGDKDAYAVMKPIFEAIAAKVNGEPCVTYIGPGASGHFVKMVHNGIEYGIMQVIAETYEILKKGLKLGNDEIGDLFTKWNEGRLKSFLLDITKDIFKYKAPGTDHLLLDDIKDEAKAKGTGKWTSQVAMDLVTPIPTIDTSVSMRDLSKYKSLREKASALYNDPIELKGDKEELLVALEQAFYFTSILTYAQGMHLLTKASEEYKYDLHLGEIAKIWRGGCIIRSEFLNDIYNAYNKDQALPHLLLDSDIQALVAGTLPGIRKVLSATIAAGVAAPGYASALSYFDAFRSERMPSNLTQAQRDYFGAHTYELIGKEGTFHTQWAPAND